MSNVERERGHLRSWRKVSKLRTVTLGVVVIRELAITKVTLQNTNMMLNVKPPVQATFKFLDMEISSILFLRYLIKLLQSIGKMAPGQVPPPPFCRQALGAVRTS